METNNDKASKHSEIDDVVIAQAVMGDPSALALMYDSYTLEVYRYCYSRVGNATDAEDLTAQTFMAMIEALPRYHHRGHFSAWVFKIAHNKIMDLFRKQRRDPIDIPLDVAYSEDVLDEVIKGQTYEKLSSLLENLQEDERELIRLRYVVRLSFVEMAAMLGRREDAVRKSLNRLVERLYSQMEVQNV